MGQYYMKVEIRVNLLAVPINGNGCANKGGLGKLGIGGEVRLTLVAVQSLSFNDRKYMQPNTSSGHFPRRFGYPLVTLDDRHKPFYMVSYFARNVSLMWTKDECLHMLQRPSKAE